MNVLTIFQGIFMVSSSKTYGENKIRDEKFLTLVASLANFCGACRFFWSFLLDKYSYRSVYGIIILLQIIIGFSFPTIMDMPPSKSKSFLYAACVCISFNCEGGHFVLAPTIYAKLFGANGGIRVFSVGFCFIGIASLLNIFFVNMLLETIGFPGFCYLYASFNVVALPILMFVFK